MNERKFWFYNAIGSTLWAVTIICIGIFFADHYETILDNLEKIVLVVIIGFALYTYFFRREHFIEYMRAKEEEIQEKIEKKRQQKNQQ